jgi:penicillin-binding protein 2
MEDVNRQEIKQRKLIINIFISILFLLLFYGFLKIQIIGAEKYYQQSLDNSVRQLTEYPFRGTIRDRTGKILVDNRPSFLVSVIPRQLTKNTISLLAEILNDSCSYIHKKIEGRRTFRPEIIKRDIDYQTVARLEESRLNLPGVIVEVEGKRYYPPNVFSPHIFGYVGEVSGLETYDGKKYEPGEMIGKDGLEYIYDDRLRGTKGINYVRVDAEGRELDKVGSERNINAISGMDLYLTLDYSYQQFAESLMIGKRGAVVVLDVKTGGILAFVSKPDFDPRLLSGKVSPEVWRNLENDPEHPLYNRVTQGRYPPGSTFKLVAATAALQEKIITPRRTDICQGYFKIGKKTIKCWNTKGHGKIDLLTAIKGSCNVYFIKLGLEIGIETWAKYSKIFLFGQPTGIDLPNETSGLVPTREYYDKIYGVNGWTRGNLANLAIGQGELLTTPLQMAQFAMILATKGIAPTPHLIDSTYDKQNDKIIPYHEHITYIEDISEDVYNIIRGAMLKVVAEGTGRSASVYNIKVAGKTGTAQNPGEDHSWFIGFAPLDQPQIAIAVIVENAGAGSMVAAPISRMMMEKYFYHRILPRVFAKKDTTQTDTTKIDTFKLNVSDSLIPIHINQNNYD